MAGNLDGASPRSFSCTAGLERRHRCALQFVFGSIQIRDAVLSLEHRKSVEVVDKVRPIPSLILLDVRLTPQRPQLLDSFNSLAFKDLGEIINNVVRRLYCTCSSSQRPS